MQEIITPLVWLFGIFVFLSIPLVAYNTWIKNPVFIQESVNHPSMDKNRPNILLITFDAMTAEDMSVYGYQRSTTPFINKWAKSAYLFTRAEAESNSTNPTTASLMTGKRLWTHQVYHQMGNKPVRIDTESLPLLLKRNGFYNMAFIANAYASVNTLGVSNRFDVAPSVIQFKKTASAFSWGVEKIDKVLYKLFSDKIRLYDWLIKEDFICSKLINVISKDFDQTNVPPDLAFNKFLEALNNVPSSPYFAWIHVLPPHNPYLPPKNYMGMYERSPKLRSYKSQLGLLNKKFDQETADIARGRYDEFIKYCDKQLEDFIAELEKRGVQNNTVIILSADHGESFEHEFIGHNGSRLYEQLTHIPLIIKIPGQQSGKIIDALVEQIDIPATILDLASISIPPWMEGQSLMPLIRGEGYRSDPIFSGFFENNYGHGNKIVNGTVAVWEGDYKMIHYLDKEKSLLFNLKTDPDELNNLFSKEPETGNRLLGSIKYNLNEANKKIVAER
jgi:arylsulfatase A-like enzyme